LFQYASTELPLRELTVQDHGTQMADHSLPVNQVSHHLMKMKRLRYKDQWLVHLTTISDQLRRDLQAQHHGMNSWFKESIPKEVHNNGIMKLAGMFKLNPS